MGKLNFIPVNRLESTMPKILNKELESYDSERVMMNDDFFYLVDRKYVYSQALLSINQYELKQTFEWLLWVNFNAKKFIELSENLSRKKCNIEALTVSEIPFYEDTKNIKIMLEFELKEKSKFPRVIILNNHKQLYTDYTKGVAKNTYLEWQKALGVV